MWWHRNIEIWWRLSIKINRHKSIFIYPTKLQRWLNRRLSNWRRYPNIDMKKKSTCCRTLLQTTVMKKLIHKIFVIIYDSSCFPIVTVWFLFVWVFLTECSTYDLESGFVETYRSCVGVSICEIFNLLGLIFNF
jgi:hypothetical protein